MSDIDRSSKKFILPPAPSDRDGLGRWVWNVLGLRIPSRAVCPSHNAPLDYLAASFLPPGPGAIGLSKPLRTDPAGKSQPADLLVWANRGGGKTMLAAIASLMDALYKRPISIRIIGGSFDQSDRLADHLRGFLSGDLAEKVEGKMTRERIVLSGGADIRMLSQSQRAVRGQHAQKIRCDEVDLFDTNIWKALQFTTRSSDRARGGIEVFSTLHCPGGLMEQLVNHAGENNSFRIFKWCLWEVIERCGPERRCDDCPLAEDCEGKARTADGFFRIDDAISIKARSSRSMWEAEMLCLGARRDRLVFAEFDPDLHVADLRYCPDWPIYRAIDFGYSSPFVCLWVQLSPAGMVHVIDEYALKEQPIPHHAVEMLRRSAAIVAGREPEDLSNSGNNSSTPTPPTGNAALIGSARPMITYVDPAGSAKEVGSGEACTDLLAEYGINCTWRASTINEGLELIRAVLAPAMGPTRLKINRRCRKLIEAFQNYHYPPPGSTARSDKPVKDGPDHYIDALRYFFVNRARPRMFIFRKEY